ncbi:Phage portal protein (plasmid) [Deinococcus geothermalis DSM 11300]|uniref:Phage portal protein n=1 Tax=Deinococcus geothermalis (strain DSM 11300 / CIP 105573 / AG-3a) TaxID=319795 RepID=A8ZRE7_DEIGD|nr:phage portal protein [Deinococcus geothermalis]ABW35056.1 Phage portal protein [Deinococcus geothermalis DSM 11300]
MTSTVSGMVFRPRKTRHGRSVLPPYRPDVVDALRRGPADEQQHATASFVMPTAAELARLDEFQEAYGLLAKAQPPRPRRGVAMSQIEIGGEQAPGLTLTRPVGLTFEQLRAVAKGNPIVGLIIKTRIAQVQRFLGQPAFEYEPGLNFRFKDRSRKIQPEDAARFAWLRRYLNACGAEFDPRKRRALQRDNLFEFTAKHLRDSLTLDAAPIEYNNTRTGRVHGFSHVDGAKVFLTDPNAGLTDDYDGPAEFNVLTGRTNFGDPSNIIAVYAQAGQPKAYYTHMDLLYPVRNKTGEEEYFGYGVAEPETILNISTAWLNAFTLNARSISDNAIPRGILSILGEYQQEDIQALKAQWLAQLRGANNRFRLPILVGEPEQGAGVNFIPTGAQVDDALYSRWMTLLTAISCSTYLMDPAEIAFESFSAGGASTLSGSDTEAKLTSSEDKGLHTLLTWYGSTLNEVVEIVDDEVECYWTGLNSTKEDDQQREQTTMLFGEVRERHGQSNDGIPDEVLKAPSSVAGQVYMALLQAKQQQQMMQQQAQPPGQDGGGGGEGQGGDGPDGQPQGGAADTTPDDPEHPTGPQGEQRFKDHEGAVWQAGQDDEDPQQVAKAYVPTLLDTWPEG